MGDDGSAGSRDLCNAGEAPVSQHRMKAGEEAHSPGREGEGGAAKQQQLKRPSHEFRSQSLPRMPGGEWLVFLHWDGRLDGFRQQHVLKWNSRLD